MARLGASAGVFLAALAIVVTTTGCGEDEPGPVQVNDDYLIESVVGGLGGDAGVPEVFKEQFAEGAAPSDAERQKYSGCYFRVVSTNVSGDTATAKVEVSGRDEKPIGQVEWTLVKQGDRWVLKTAPLP